MRWEPTPNHKLNARRVEVVPQKRRPWKLERCIPLVILGTVLAMVILQIMLQAWLFNETPKEVWWNLYMISILGR